MGSFIGLWLLGSLAAQGPRWTPIGPDLGGVGRVIIDPREPDTIYGIGIKSNDRGQSWRRSGGISFARQMLLDPLDPESLYAASRSVVGLSRDGGATFTTDNEGIPRSITMVAHDPAVSGKLYLASSDFSSGGLFVSEDRGASWQALGEGTARERLQGVWTHPTDSNVLFVFSFVSSGTIADDGIYRSADGGQTWNRVLDFLSPSTSIVGQAAFPQRLYALRNPTDRDFELYRSQDSGATWVKIYEEERERWDDLKLDPVTGLPRFARVQSYFPRFGNLHAIDSGEIRESLDGGQTWQALPAAAGWDVIALGGDTSALFASLAEGGVMASFDQGQTWQDSSHGRTRGFRQLVTHPDRSGRIIAYNVKTPYLWVTEDGGASWEGLETIRLPQSEFESFQRARLETVSLDPSNPRTRKRYGP